MFLNVLLHKNIPSRFTCLSLSHGVTGNIVKPLLCFHAFSVFMHLCAHICCVFCHSCMRAFHCIRLGAGTFLTAFPVCFSLWWCCGFFGWRFSPSVLFDVSPRPLFCMCVVSMLSATSRQHFIRPERPGRVPRPAASAGPRSAGRHRAPAPQAVRVQRQPLFGLHQRGGAVCAQLVCSDPR